MIPRPIWQGGRVCIGRSRLKLIAYHRTGVKPASKRTSMFKEYEVYGVEV